MRIFVTGGCGKLGAAVRRLGAAEHTFTFIDVAEHTESDGGVRASVTDRDAVLRLTEGCDAIVHTAAMHGLFRGKASNQQFIQTNVIGAENLFEAARKHGIRRLVMSSTLEVIYGVDCLAYGTAITDEDTPPRPDWIYPVTKRMVELMSEHYALQHGLEVVNLRYANILPWPVEKMGFQLLARGLHTDDYARANLLAATVAGITCHVLHCAPESPLNAQDVYAVWKDPRPVLEKYWPGCGDVLRSRNLEPRPKDFFPITRVARARQVLGWRPSATFADFLRCLGWTGQPAFAV